MVRHGPARPIQNFRYGNDRIEPPQLGLAKPIAERGAAAIPFLTEQLRFSKDDAAVRDIMLVLKTMQYLHTYKVRGDAALMSVLELRISKMKSRDWQAYAREQMENIKNTPQ
jgi:hypothetical protein